VRQDKDKKSKKSKKAGPSEALKPKPFTTALAEAMLDRVRPPAVDCCSPTYPPFPLCCSPTDPSLVATVTTFLAPATRAAGQRRERVPCVPPEHTHVGRCPITCRRISTWAHRPRVSPRGTSVRCDTNVAYAVHMPGMQLWRLRYDVHVQATPLEACPFACVAMHPEGGLLTAEDVR
jgi:hypothetical protein